MHSQGPCGCIELAAAAGIDDAQEEFTAQMCVERVFTTVMVGVFQGSANALARAFLLTRAT